MLQDGPIVESPTAKNLGIWIDSSLSMERHINEVCKTCLYYLKWIRNIRSCLTIDMTKSLVQTLVISRIDYCNALFYNLPYCLLKKLQRVMNIAARLIFKSPQDASVTELMKELHWLKIEERIIFKVLTLTWKSLHQMTPPYISNLVTIYNPTRSLRSTNSLKLRVPKTRTRYGDRSFQKAAPELWNNLPIRIREQTNLSLFKRALKTHLFKMSYNC